MNTVKQFYRFLIAGGIAAGVNYGSRFVLNLFFSFEISVVIAYLLGMLTAFPLMRVLVFAAEQGSYRTQMSRFLGVNLLGIAQTFLISVFLNRVAFPAIHFEFHPEAIAHFVGLITPILTNYAGHRYFTFRTEPKSGAH